MKLLTQDVRKRLPPLRSQEQNPDPMVPVKFFDPTGAATWWIIEGEDEDDDFLMFGFVNLGDLNCAELGNVSMNELQSFKGRFGIGIERDLYWMPVPLSEVRAKLGLP